MLLALEQVAQVVAQAGVCQPLLARSIAQCWALLRWWQVQVRRGLLVRG